MILIALGSNLPGPWGSPRQTVLKAVAEMERRGIHVLAQSRLIETAPMGPPNQPRYVNGVVAVRSAKPPDGLLRTLHGIERAAGRVRRLRWGPRTLDLDIIDCNGLVRKPAATSHRPLALPHPGLAARSFVLAPIAEIAPRWRHPLTRETAAFMLRKLSRLKRV